MASLSIRTDEGLRLHARHWAAPRPRRGAVLLVHGYAEHAGRYDHVAAALADIGVDMYAFDLRGHGQSEGNRAYVDSFGRYLSDLSRGLQRIRTVTPDVPLFLFGHSMGGLIVLTFVLNRSPSLRGILLSAPSIEINPDLSPVLQWCAQALGRLAPTVPTAQSPQGAISRDPAVVAAAEQDPLNYHGRVKARTGAEMLRAGTEARERLDELSTPFLVVHGTADRLASPKWSRRLYEQAAAEDKTIRLYDGLYHETFNEPEREMVLQDLQDWFGSRLS